jgi:hypothetical protein
MAARSLLLWQISTALRRLGGDEIRSVPELREAYPEIAKAYPKMGLSALEEIRDRLEKGESICPPPTPPKPDGRLRNRRSTLTDQEICDRINAGETRASIAKIAGVSRARIGQILQANVH